MCGDSDTPGTPGTKDCMSPDTASIQIQEIFVTIEYETHCIVTNPNKANKCLGFVLLSITKTVTTTQVKIKLSQVKPKIFRTTPGQLVYPLYPTRSSIFEEKEI